MLAKFQAFREFINKKEESCGKLDEIVRKYSYFYIDESFNQDLKNDFNQSIAKSTVIMINHYKDQSMENDELHFIIGFRKTILIIKHTFLTKLQQLFLDKKELKICFCFENIKNYFDKSINIKYEELKQDKFFDEEISEICEEFFTNNSDNTELNQFVKDIKSCISGYLIQQSYCKTNYDRFNDFYSTKEKIIPREMKDSELIELRMIGIGSSFKTNLYYHIYDEQFYVIKKPNGNESEIIKLLEREQNNYKRIKHPFIPKYYGTINIYENICPVIEFINCQTLDKTDISQFPISDKINIIIQLLSVIKYLHENNFIYRDLKPNNVIIDQNRTAVVIDFDRMIEDKNSINEINIPQTIDLNNVPEINDPNLTNKCDIYSFGQMIKEIIPDIENNEYYSMICLIYKKCTDKTPTKRPSILDLYCLFFIFIENKNISINLSPDFSQNDPQTQSNLGKIYYLGQCISRDINKAIYYLTLAANQNYPEAQYNLGVFYEEGPYFSRDINKAIYYYSLAANQNFPDAQLNLGVIYEEGQYISRDMNKAIYYYSLAANQNIPEAQFNLGVIYYKGQYISRDMNKSIYYLTLAANQNHPQAQNNLGLIYSEGQYISRDINKAIYYYSLAAKQNYPKAQYNLGLIYSEGQYISRDMNKAIYYYSLAANQNHPQAQYNLGNIYYKGQYISRDINKAIYYYILAANQNIPGAHFNLGVIYSEGQYISRDMKKAIYYYSLAANQNHPEAQYNLGLIYYLGQYISRDIDKAIYYYSLSANQNIPQAQFNLGVIYSEGQYISRNINKAIYYYSLAAKQNHPQAQNNLGLIYSKGQYISRDMNKAIYYYSLAANQNIPQAQYNLGVIYSEGQYISRDMKKAIYYYSLAANQNHPEAQYNLGLIYSEGQYISRDMNKAIYYYSLAANQNIPQAQNNLGLIYYLGQYISRDMNKAIYYLTLAANQNIQESQFNLGLIYYRGIFIKQNIKRGIYWINKSSNNECIQAQFALGFLYQEGKYMKKNIEESIKYYKKASSFNNEYAKNNLGIIYKNYIEKKYDYTVYFEEAIGQKNDPVSMYNLSHAYIYKYQDDELINKTIELLIKSSNHGFKPSTVLLCLIILKRFHKKQKNDHEIISIENIKQELSDFIEETDELAFSIIDIIEIQQLYDQSIFEQYYKRYEEIEFVYNLFKEPVCIKELYNEEKELKLKDSNEEYNITKDFYEGFGYDIF